MDPAPPPGPRGVAERPAVQWGIGDFFWIYFAGIFVSVFLAQIGVAITGDTADHLGALTTGLALFGQFGGWIGGLVWVSRRKGRGTLRTDFGLVVRIRNGWYLVAGVVLEIGLGLMVAPLVNLVNNEHQDVVHDLESSRGVKLALLALVAGLVAPICEELLFRGLLLRALRRRFSPAVAVGLSALVFAFAHLIDPTLGTLAVVPALFALGAISGAVAVRSGDLSKSILLHVGFNLLTTASAIQSALKK